MSAAIHTEHTARRPGIEPDPADWPQAQTDALERAWADGLSTLAIAARLTAMPGMPARSKNSVIGKARRMRLPPRKNPVPTTAATAARRIRAHKPRPAAPQAPQPPQRQAEPASPPPPKPIRAPIAPASYHRTCQFCLPSGEAFPRWRYCGEPTAPGRRLPYCPTHYAVVIVEKDSAAA